LVNQQASPLHELNVAAIPVDDAFVVQLACESLHILVKARFKHIGGVKTHVKGVAPLAFLDGEKDHFPYRHDAVASPMSCSYPLWS